MRLRFVDCEFWGFSGGFSRLGGSSTARRRVDGVPPAHFPSRTFLVRALNPRDVSLSGRVLQGRGAVLLEVRAELHHAAHGARMAPRGGLEGPRQARQRSSRYCGHGAKKTDPPLGPPYCRAVSNHEGFQRALVGSIQAAARLGPGVPRATTSLFWLSGWDLNPSSDPWDASLPTDRQREGRLAQASHAASRSRGLPKHPAIRCRANTVSSYLPSESATPVDAQ